MALRQTFAALLFVALAACSSGANNGASGSAAGTADDVTKAVYNNDVDGVTSNFDDRLKSRVSRGEVGTLSDKMHALGDYKGLTYVNGDTSKSEYTYRANFERGTMNVVIRVDSDGKLSAYRIFSPT